METLSVDITLMPKGFADFKYLLVTEITNFMFAISTKLNPALVLQKPRFIKLYVFWPTKISDC